ncbi:MAG: FtsX-like permease family protein [Ruminococcus sp.]|nr:FtsX-like permease family protein [Ruminococcus sp.]
MKTGLYSKIAAGNIKNNARLYIPRILAEAGLLGCFYILFTLALDQRLSEALGGAYLEFFMMMGAVLIGLLSFILILYINRFLMKQRKSEYGLYNVLGMEKRHITRVLFRESLYTSLISVVLGIVFGILFYKLSSLLICRLLQAQIVAGFYYLDVVTVLIPVLIFAALDLFAFFFNCIGIYRLKPVELLKGKQVGEKEPKIKWVLLILGVLCVGAGYYICLTTQSPLEALLLFFAAAILIIAGTYFLFITGTTFVLKCLKKNKNYYYNKKHMPAVSGLLFRMKHNAVGLASIALLATGVLIMISTTVSLYSGVDDTINEHYPSQLYLSALLKNGDEVTPIPSDQLEEIVREAADKNGLTIESITSEQSLTVSYLLRDGKLLTKTEVSGGYKPEELTNVIYITEAAYERLAGQKDMTDPHRLGLKDDEIAFCRILSTSYHVGDTPSALTVNSKEYRIKEQLAYFPVDVNTGTIVDTVGIVVANDAVLNELYQAQKKAYGEFASEYADKIGVSFSDESAAAAVGEELEKDISASFTDTGVTYDLDTKWDSKKNVLEMYGTFLFLGILLGFVCLFSTVLIIYYKQISEGYEDRGRFQIMEKIGMEPGEVKKTIGSQLRLQMFLPLITAAIHTAFAFPILLKLLNILMLSNTGLFVLCSIITFALFAIVYTAVYFLTSKTYYKIVH